MNDFTPRPSLPSATMDNRPLTIVYRPLSMVYRPSTYTP
jgi:hypothetical protein